MSEYLPSISFRGQILHTSLRNTLLSCRVSKGSLSYIYTVLPFARDIRFEFLYENSLLRNLTPDTFSPYFFSDSSIYLSIKASSEKPVQNISTVSRFSYSLPRAFFNPIHWHACPTKSTLFPSFKREI